MKRINKFLLMSMVLAAFTMIRCEQETGEEGKPDTTEGTGKEDAWNYENDPSRFQADMNYKIAELPQDGTAAQMPWSETWWPLRKDGYNQRWQGTGVFSPLEKYDVAFNNWTAPEGFMDLEPFSYPGSEFDADYYEKLGPAAKWESANGGNAMARNGRDDDGDDEIDESGDWDGLGSWWGKCHCWSAVSIIAPEPRRAVEYNGVTFEYSDLTALIMETYYNRSKSYMLGGRCNDEEIARDDHGRPTEVDCRDTNAGSFHVVVSNMLGRHGRAFVMDASSGFEVWNHPVTDFTISSQEEVTLEKALQLLDRTDVTEYPYNDDAKAFYEVRMTLGYATDGVSPSKQPHGNVRSSKSYHYLLEVDGSANIIGGEWIGDVGPDFFWLPTMSNYSRGGNPSVKFSNVEMLVEMATREDEPPPPSGDEKVVESSGTVNIPDNSPDGVTSTITISDSDNIASMKVNVDITHTYIGDLKVELRHGGKTVLLHNKSGGSTDNLKEEYAITDFIGAAVSGAWELFISDTASIDTGALNGWSITYAPGEGGTSGNTTTQISHSNETAVSVPDNDATGATSAINVSESGGIRRVVVNLDLTHTYIGDLYIELKHAGTGIVLHNRTGGSNDNIVKEYTLSDFNNLNANGEWTLFITDNAGRDLGTLNKWTIKFEVEE
ncbi:MAG: proprotein convertase P-domain-containing protein [Pseudomonadota bacterium]